MEGIHISPVQPADSQVRLDMVGAVDLASITRPRLGM